jgi:PKD repeat protein
MKKIFLTLSLVIFGLGLFASPVSIQSAQQVAINFYKHYAIKTTDYTISDQYSNLYNGITTFYVFSFKSGGFVMIAADDASIPVLGYSTDNTFDKNNLPVNAKEWFDHQYSKQIKAIVDANVGNTETVKEWKKIQDNQFPDTKGINVVTPLLTTKWDQSPYYNAMCPGTGSNQAVTGCVATAMAQVMKFWSWPTTGVGSHTDNDATTTSTYGAQTANFGATTYNWSGMPNSVTSSNTAVATLMFHCGVSVDMSYSPSASGAQETALPGALMNYFDYQNTAEAQFEASFTPANWITLLETELDGGRPVLYSGDNGTEGHSFVFDGFDASNNFHVNWGWSGMSNGYFAIGALNAGGYQFNFDNTAIVRVRPKLATAPIANFTASTTTPAVGASVNFTDLSSNSPTTWTWTFDGGTPATYNGQTPPAISYAGPAGYYQVTLTVTNANGSDTKTISQYINVGGTPSKWILQNSAFKTAYRGISCISIVNPFIVWAGAIDGATSTNYIQEFTRTVNGGLTWTADSIIFTGSSSTAVGNLCAFNDTVCYAAMFPGAAANGGYIAKTSDGGKTWSIAGSPSYSTSWLDFVHFYDVNNGICVGDPNTSHQYIIYTTSNGGTSWTQVPVSNIPIATTGETAIVNQFDAIGDTLWFGTTMGRVYKSSDKGLTWTVCGTTGFATTIAITPVFRSGSVGIITGSTYSNGVYVGMKRTIDGGATWTAVTQAAGSFYLKNPNIAYVPGTASMWVDGSAGPGTGSSYSLDDCSSFLDIDTASTFQYTSVKFYDINTGWAGSFTDISNLGGIYKWDASILGAGIKPINENAGQVNIYPNPASNIVNIEFSSITTKSVINVYNLVGEKILSKEVNPSYSNLLQLNMSAYRSGIYLVTIDTGKNIITKRVMLIK